MAAGQKRVMRRQLPVSAPRLHASSAAPGRQAAPLPRASGYCITTKERDQDTQVRVAHRNAPGARNVLGSRTPELAAGGVSLRVGRPWPDNLAPQGRRAATIGSQTHPGKLPVPVLSVVRKDSPRDVPGCAARQVEYQVGVLRHYHLLCAQMAMIQSACGNQFARNALGGLGSDVKGRGASGRPKVASGRTERAPGDTERRRGGLSDVPLCEM